VNSLTILPPRLIHKCLHDLRLYRAIDANILLPLSLLLRQNNTQLQDLQEQWRRTECPRERSSPHDTLGQKSKPQRCPRRLWTEKTERDNSSSRIQRVALSVSLRSRTRQSSRRELSRHPLRHLLSPLLSKSSQRVALSSRLSNVLSHLHLHRLPPSQPKVRGRLLHRAKARISQSTTRKA
jgi:hypothetical protein